MLKNILCDRDGTIIYDKHYLSDPDGVELLPGALRGLQMLNEGGCGIFIVTNQSGIGRGMFSLEQYYACANRLEEILSASKVPVRDTVFCPHAPVEGQGICTCRKPGAGMWHELAGRYNLRASESVMLGDKIADIMFGKNAGLAKTILVLTGKGEAAAQKLALPYNGTSLHESGFLELPASADRPDCVAINMEAAATYILRKNKDE